MSSALDQAFLQDILANPEGDAPRLIYADWLQEHRPDDPEARDRAEFIRVQCELERLEEDDGRTWLLRGRADELLAAHEKAWLGPVRVLGQRWEFRRGFIEQGRLATGQFHSHAGRLFALIPLQRLELWRPSHQQAFAMNCGPICKMPCLARLRRLSLLHGFGDEDFLDLATTTHLSGLSELAVALPSFGPQTMKVLAAMPALEQLCRLELAAGKTGGSVKPLLEARRLASIEDLKLSGEELTPQELALLPSALPGLRSLELAVTRLPSTLLAPVAAAALQQLHVLRVSSNTLSIAVLPSLVDLLQGGQLRHLVLACQDHGGATSVWSHHLPRLPFLCRLELPMSRIPEDGIQRLARSSLLNGLTLLNLQGNLSGDAGAKALAESLDLQDLRVLNLRSNHLGDEGVRALANSTILGNLSYLDLRANHITDRGAEALARSACLGHLVCLRLSRNAITSRGEEMLRERLGTGVFL